MKYYQKNGLTIEKKEQISITINNETIELDLSNALELKNSLRKAIEAMTEDEIKKINEETTIEPMTMEFFNTDQETIKNEEIPKKEFKLFDNDNKKTEYYY